MTLYLKSDDNTNIDQYPYTYTDLRADNPNKSYPRDTATAMGLESNVYEVTVLAQPAHDANTQYLTQNATPVKNKDTWELDWTINNYSVADLRRLAYNPVQLSCPAIWTKLVYSLPVN